MKKTLSLIWFYWKKIGLIIGDFVSAIFLTVFYFTIFALFAIPFRIFSKKIKEKTSNFYLKEKTISKLEDFKNEY